MQVHWPVAVPVLQLEVHSHALDSMLECSGRRADIAAAADDRHYDAASTLDSQQSTAAVPVCEPGVTKSDVRQTKCDQIVEHGHGPSWFRQNKEIRTCCAVDELGAACASVAGGGGTLVSAAADA